MSFALKLQQHLIRSPHGPPGQVEDTQGTVCKGRSKAWRRWAVGTRGETRARVGAWMSRSKPDHSPKQRLPWGRKRPSALAMALPNLPSSRPHPHPHR